MQVALALELIEELNILNVTLMQFWALPGTTTARFGGPKQGLLGNMQSRAVAEHRARVDFMKI